MNGNLYKKPIILIFFSKKSVKTEKTIDKSEKKRYNIPEE